MSFDTWEMFFCFFDVEVRVVEVARKVRGTTLKNSHLYPLCPALVCPSFFAFSGSLSSSRSAWWHSAATKASRRAASGKNKAAKKHHCPSKKPIQALSHLEKVSEIHRAERRGLSLSGALRGARAHACTDRDVRREQRARRRVVGPGHGERKKERKTENRRKKRKVRPTSSRTSLISGRFYTFKLQPDKLKFEP